MITAVIDDDPTGTQAVADVPVLLDWDLPQAWQAVTPRDRSLHLLTNSRAHDAAEAIQLVRSAATAVKDRFPDARFLLRGDSTLRGHVWEEYEALRSVLHPGQDNIPLLLVPALPSAGRVTIDGVHMLQQGPERIPLHLTEFARDGAFSYGSSVLSRWAEERSGGRFAAGDALTVHLDRLRGPDGAKTLARSLCSAWALGRPAVVVPDAENDDDLRTIAEGLRDAEANGTPVIVRAAPAFAATLTGTGTSRTVRPGPIEGGTLILCGSFVATTSVQLKRLSEAFPDALVAARVSILAGEHWEGEVERIAVEARRRLDRRGVVAVATDRARDLALKDTSSQRRIACRLAQVAHRVEAGLVIAKGGITSAVTARQGLGARAARVVGPIRPGVSLWQLADGPEYIVFPGNVGGPDLLLEVVNAVAPLVSGCPAR